MNTIQKKQTNEPLSGRHHPRRNIRLFLAISGLSLIVAAVWAFSDMSWIAPQYGKLAIIFLTWLAIVIGAWTFTQGEG